MTNKQAPLLQVRDLRTAFHTERGTLVAVDKISFELYPDECLGLVGESGCGKSVTAMSILQLLPQPSGEVLGGHILYQGRDLLTLNKTELQKIRGGEIAMIFQDPMQALNPVMRIGEQIAEVLHLHQGLQGEAARQTAIELLRRVHIPAPEQRIDSYPHQLSGGMRQRVIIAQALAGKPKLLIADEPTTALDVTVQQQILHLLEAQSNCASILITHDLGLVAQYCQRVAVMYAGRIVELAPVVELFDKPQHAYTQALLASLPRGDKAPKSLLPTIPGQVCALDDFVQGCRFCQRMGRQGPQLQTRPDFKEIAPGHYIEACPICAKTC